MATQWFILQRDLGTFPLSGQLVAIFSDERSYWSQALVTVISDDGGDSWGRIEFALASSNIHDRPGMATVSRMENGEYILAYEYCVTADCQIYVKMSSNGSNWVSSDMGDAVSTTDGLFPASSPFIVWEPTAKQLILSSQSVYPIGNESQVSQNPSCHLHQWPAWPRAMEMVSSSLECPRGISDLQLQLQPQFARTAQWQGTIDCSRERMEHDQMLRTNWGGLHRCPALPV
ncbi:hypothetical protein N7481_011369 [Penicillium waksmanii]|uniref:uncharacterized protein n=1 Tax=Penicillium waksmanii TaxID=69791 RepID=UPI0025476F6C|nr:uncharacterized protein N7481_011369 [Penicillium waksmanii]KAJ5974159.1 hypothetical protein N7481_011369 [Penicillium waksmanii]